jgi:hypothetical protein
MNGRIERYIVSYVHIESRHNSIKICRRNDIDIMQTAGELNFYMIAYKNTNLKNTSCRENVIREYFSESGNSKISLTHAFKILSRCRRRLLRHYFAMLLAGIFPFDK